MANPIPLFNGRMSPEEKAARLRQDVTSSLYRALTRAVDGAFEVPVYLAEAFEREAWKFDRVLINGERQPPISFHDYVHESYPVGLGTTFDAIRPFIKHDIALLALYDKACQRPDGNPTGRNQHSGQTEECEIGTVDNVNGSAPVRPTGNSRQQGLRRLAKAASSGDTTARDLHEQVLKGEVSVNAACLAMGWRKTVGVVETMKRAWQKATPEERDEIRAWIGDNADDDDSEKSCNCQGKELLIGTFFAGGRSLLQRHTDDVRAASLAEFEASPDPTWLDMVNIMEKAGQRAALKIYERHADEYLEALSACAPPPPPEPEQPMRRKRSRK
jgi:hypothetical protein